MKKCRYFHIIVLVFISSLVNAQEFNYTKFLEIKELPDIGLHYSDFSKENRDLPNKIEYNNVTYKSKPIDSQSNKAEEYFTFRRGKLDNKTKKIDNKIVNKVTYRYEERKGKQVVLETKSINMGQTYPAYTTFTEYYYDKSGLLEETKIYSKEKELKQHYKYIFTNKAQIEYILNGFDIEDTLLSIETNQINNIIENDDSLTEIKLTKKMASPKARLSSLNSSSQAQRSIIRSLASYTKWDRQEEYMIRINDSGKVINVTKLFITLYSGSRQVYSKHYFYRDTEIIIYNIYSAIKGNPQGKVRLEKKEYEKKLLVRKSSHEYYLSKPETPNRRLDLSRPIHLKNEIEGKQLEITEKELLIKNSQLDKLFSISETTSIWLQKSEVHYFFY